MERNDLIERLRTAWSHLTPLDIIGADLNEIAFAIEDAISTIASLSEALAEAEKKGCILPLIWDGGDARALGLHYGVRAYRDPLNENPGYAGEWLSLTFGGAWSGRFPTEDDAKAGAQANFETRVRAWLAPPRDLSQGGQHG